MEIAEIKSRLTIAEVLRHYGLEADRNHRLHCPFHADRTPSMQVYEKTDTVYCFSSNCPTHGKSMDTIDFILHRENCTKAEAIKKATQMVEGIKPSPAQQITRVAILTKMFGYFRNAVHNSKPAQEYLKKRGIDPTKTEVGYNTGQFHHGTRKEEALIQSCTEVGLLIPWGTNSRAGGQAYKPFAKDCICFPLKNRANQISGLYFRSTINDTDQKHFYLKESSGLYPSYPKPETEKLILTEAVIDCATLLQIPEVTKEYGLLSAYGTNRLTTEHLESIKELKHLKEIIIAFDNDEAGNKAVQKYGKELKALLPQVKLTRMELEENEDINGTAQSHDPEIFLHLLERRKPLDLLLSTESGEPPRAIIKPVENGTSRTGGREEKAITQKPANTLNTDNPFKISYQTDTATYYIQGGIRSEADSMKVTLVVENNQTGQKSRNKLDLYEDKQVQKTAREAADKLNLRSDLLEADINKLTDLLDDYREQSSVNSEQRPSETNHSFPLTAVERKQAEELLKSPDLLKKINQLIGKAGVVGEEQSRLFLFAIASSYKMPDTLHALVQGSSGSGKTHLIVKVGQLMPQEDTRFLTRVTESSLYNYGETELRNKLFCMEDLDGLKEEAFLAFRELQSRGQLTSSTSEKDEKGNIRARIRTVKGPISSMSATTKGAVYEDNMGRCFLISVDESPEQTKAIIEYQNRRAAGGINKEEEKQTAHLLRNCIRILQPMEVVNPYAGQIALPEEAHKIRRLNELYQSFVKQVTLINQYKRKKDSKGRLVTEKEDLETASEIMFDSIMLKVDELDGSLRQFYERLKEYVRGKGKEHKSYAFGRKEIRDALRVSKTQQHRFLHDLYEMEYIGHCAGNAHGGFKYRVQVWDDMGALRARIKRYLQGQLSSWTCSAFHRVPKTMERRTC